MKTKVNMNSNVLKKDQQRGGRPSLESSEKRSFSYRVRFNEQEKDALRTIAKSHFIDIDSSKNVAALLRQLILKEGYNSNVRSKKNFEHLIYHIHKIGINVNQITHLSHSRLKLNPNATLDKEIKHLNGQLFEIIKALNTFKDDK